MASSAGGQLPRRIVKVRCRWHIRFLAWTKLPHAAPLFLYHCWRPVPFQSVVRVNILNDLVETHESFIRILLRWRADGVLYFVLR